MQLRSMLGIVAVFTLCGCSKSASVVGTKNLPPFEMLKRETIQLNRFGGSPRERETLGAELRPDDTLVYELRRFDLGGNSVQGTETYKLQPEAANHIRKILWRFRPEVLEGIQKELLPTGCDYVFDETPQFTVVFVGRQTKDVGAIDVQSSCRTPSAREARRLASEVLNQLPKSKLASGFWAGETSSG